MIHLTKKTTKLAGLHYEMDTFGFGVIFSQSTWITIRFLPNQHGMDITLILDTWGKQLSNCGFGFQNNPRVKELPLS